VARANLPQLLRDGALGGLGGRPVPAAPLRIGGAQLAAGAIGRGAATAGGRILVGTAGLAIAAVEKPHTRSRVSIFIEGKN
jgi:hypothetical protein